MKKLPFFTGFYKSKKKPAISIDEFKERMQRSEHADLVQNPESVSGGVLEGRSPEFIDLTPSHTHRNFNSEFDMLP